MNETEVHLFFQLIAERYEEVPTSNKFFSEWGEMIGDNGLATVILDRLLPHSTIVNIRIEAT